VDRLVQQEFELNLSIGRSTPTVGEHVQQIQRRKTQIEKHRRKLIRQILVIGFCLIISLLLSILALGMPNVNWSYPLAFFALVLLFTGVFLIFWMLSRLSEMA
jgi:fatty acid desaturase